MLDTSYGFNNLLKEVSIHSLRDINTSQDSKKSFSKTLMLAKKLAQRSKDLLVLSVSTLTLQKYPNFILFLSDQLQQSERIEIVLGSFCLFKYF